MKGKKMARMNRSFVFLTTFLALGLLGNVALKGWSKDKADYENVFVDQFVEMMNHKDFILINVHIPYEGELPETDLLIPFNVIDQRSDELPSDKDAKIVVYCMTGPMGHIAAEKLVQMGYTRVIHFQGGMRAWRVIGRPLLFRSERTKKSL